LVECEGFSGLCFSLRYQNATAGAVVEAALDFSGRVFSRLLDELRPAVGGDNESGARYRAAAWVAD
jgi:hypothetical protein